MQIDTHTPRKVARYVKNGADGKTLQPRKTPDAGRVRHVLFLGRKSGRELRGRQTGKRGRQFHAADSATLHHKVSVSARSFL